MPIHKSRVQEEATEMRSTLEEELLLALNNDSFPTSGKRIREEVDPRVLLLFVKRIQQLSEALEWAREMSKSSHPADIAIQSRVRLAFIRVDRLLRRYTVIPTVRPTPWYSGWELIWRQVGKRSRPFLEFSLVLRIKELAEEGRISSLKQCANCNRWLFARFSHQRFCGDTCKETFHRTSPEDKARRREWARKNYWLHKNKNIK